MDICLFWMLCVVRWRLLLRADPSSREVLLSLWPGAKIILYTYSEFRLKTRCRQPSQSALHRGVSCILRQSSE